MNVIRATIRHGRIETDEPVPLPDGTEILVPLPEASVGADREDESPEEIAAWLRQYDLLQPLIFTKEELAALEADRQARREWEMANFKERAEKLAGLWK